MEQIINNPFVTVFFGGAQIALSTWTGVLLILAITDKESSWMVRVIDAKGVMVTCLATGAAVTLFNVVRGHYTEAVVTLVIALLWYLMYKDRRHLI